MWSVFADFVCNKRGQAPRPVVGSERSTTCNNEANVSFCDKLLGHVKFRGHHVLF